jgi:hypothetical protein
MAKYLVGPPLYPGIFRAGIGFFKPGDVIELPDAASKPSDVPSRHLIPLDPEAAATLKKAHGEKAHPLPADIQAEIDKLQPKEDGPAPLRAALEQMGLTPAKAAVHSGGGKRASDR